MAASLWHLAMLLGVAAMVFNGGTAAFALGLAAGFIGAEAIAQAIAAMDRAGQPDKDSDPE